MALKLRLKRGDRLVIGSGYLEIEKVSKTVTHVSVEAPEEVAIFIRRKTACTNSKDTVKKQ
tara:strand:- start:1025 stop:1207 length:183 start_codon:yes stop_codon:yes gene_type:complete